MALFKNNKKVGLFSDIIRCDEPEYLVWKWHPDGQQPGEHKREYAIRWGSQLRVKDGEVAVFVYRQKNGKMQDYIVGPFDQKLKTANFPVLSGILGAFVGGDTPFQAEIYFINLAKVIQSKFAVPYFDVYDPRFADFGVPVAVRGSITFSIADYCEFIKLHRLVDFDLDTFQKQIRDTVARYIKNAVTNAITDSKMSVLQIERKIDVINQLVENDLRYILKDTFGVIAKRIDISAIEVDKTSDGYESLKVITQDVVTAKTAIDLENYAETLRIQREEGQYRIHKETQTQNLGAFSIQKQAEVGIAGAEALGQMSANGAGDVNLGDGSGFNMAGLMTSIAMGSVVGKNIAGTMDGMLSNINQPVAQSQMPPPIPNVTFHLAKNGQSTGPFSLEKLKEMAMLGHFVADDYVWQVGMKQWEQAKNMSVFQGFFAPPIP